MVGRRDREEKERTGEGNEGERGKERSGIVAERGGVESFSHRPVAGAPRVGEEAAQPSRT